MLFQSDYFAFRFLIILNISVYTKPYSTVFPIAHIVAKKFSFFTKFFVTIVKNLEVALKMIFQLFFIFSINLFVTYFNSFYELNTSFCLRTVIMTIQS